MQNDNKVLVLHQTVSRLWLRLLLQ